jgi:signal peptidase I
MAKTAKQGKKKRSGLGGLVEMVITVAIAVALAFLIQAFVVKPYRIPSLSMYPTLHMGQRILVNRLSTHPKIGEVVVFHPPEGANEDDTGGPQCGAADQGPSHSQPCDQPTRQKSSQTFVKRVVGVGGDRLTIRNGYVFNDGRKETGSYIQQCSDPSVCTYSGSITVPAGDYYMMGDNRGDSDDSRFWGPVPRRWIIGSAFFTYWPPDRIGGL